MQLPWNEVCVRPPHGRHLELSEAFVPSVDGLLADPVAFGDLWNGFRVSLTQIADYLVLGKSALPHGSLS